MYKDYITGQTALTLNLDFTIPNNHLATVIGWFVDSIPEEVLLGDTAKTGRPAYHPAMMLKILLFAYSRRVFSGRKIELLLAENLPLMVLAEHQQISYHTINNFRSSDHANELVKKSFLYFTNLLEAEGLINEGALFIDGTKIAADANRYTFVWRKAVEKFHEKLKGQAVELYDELITKEVVKAMAQEQVQTSQGLTELARETEAEIEKLTEEIAQEPKVIPGGSPKKARRRGLKKLLHQLKKDYVPRMKKYEEAEKIFAGRNSYSKTDHDTTFMHMKEDHMKNGQLKPGYNIQAATTNQYVVDFALYPNPTDFKTLEPFLKQMTTLDKFDKIVADAGYGSEYNYSLLEDKYSNKKYYIPYTMYEKEQTRKYKNDPTKLINWFYNEKDDYYLNQNGVKFNFKYYSQRQERSTGQVRDFKVYEADEVQLTPELEQLAKTKSGYQRQVRYNPNWQYLKEKAKAVLQSPEGRHNYSMRKYDVEPVFGHLKNVFGMRRTHLRGKKKVETDVGIAFMMMNLSKYWHRSWPKDYSFLFKNKKRQKKTIKLRVKLIVFCYLGVSFFPDTFCLYFKIIKSTLLFLL
ncbi:MULTISPECIES: IS1182 family transposase [unclassified Lactobacillus]|uniref:IS1182 family transposase n=1 Tax=unclassified Lactobacillus TaxID=2620435 RepID=UPI0018DCD6B0|nr:MULTISPECIES: IS1182 family transposase [unclassified Lactobacillus]MBH9989677.1 IS1182 family transposase [Lactobacillus sp. M0392]MBI0024278.1 IS1182 family transposase [Lactobacillus sp. W8171]MBI0044718.1 IS1182 family transposase [Lactobacillus sp. M0393]